MLQLLGWILLAIIVAGGLCALAVFFLPAGEQIAPAVRDEPVWELPRERELVPADVDAVRLPVALRGYRFAETDLLLDRLAEEIRSRDATIAQLRQLRADWHPHTTDPHAAPPADVAPVTTQKNEDTTSGGEPAADPRD